MEVEEFTPLVFAATDDGDVLTVVRYTHCSRETGKAASMHLHHWFRLTEGKIWYCRSTEDTAGTVEALTPERGESHRLPGAGGDEGPETVEVRARDATLYEASHRGTEPGEWIGGLREGR